MDIYTDFPQDKTLVDLFNEQVLRTPNNIAIEFEGEALSYRALNDRANQLANYLISQGVVPDSLVPICLNRSLDMIIAALAVLKAGGAYVPIDPDYPIDRIQYTLDDTNGTVIIAESEGPLSQKNCKNPLLFIDLQWKSILEESKESPQTKLLPQHLAYVIYTSGSTGRPKGVMIEHRNLVQLFDSNRFPFSFTERDVWTMFHSFCFDFSVWEMYGALLSGGKLIVIPPHMIKDSLAYSKFVINKKVTILNQTPSAFYVIQENLLEQLEKNYIRYVFLGGESLNPTKLKQWKLIFPSCDLVNLYGITETAIVITYQPIGQSDCESNLSAIGKPFPNYTTFVLNEKLEHVMPGEEGELHVGGPGLARGYLNMPDLTSQRFIPSPPCLEHHSLLYRTGDLVIMDKNGRLEYISRIDDQVKIRGFRIELREIENVLLEHNDVQQAVVLARDDESGTKRLYAYLVSNATFDKDEILSFLESRVPSYMVPQFIIPINEVPLTLNGKIDKKNLPEPQSSELVNTMYVAPTSKIQISIIDAWKKVLKLSKIGINDNFFELGGNSLLAQSSVTALSNYDITIPVTAIYQHPTALGLELFLTSSNVEKQERKNESKNSKEVAVIAMSGRFPGANSIDQLWENLKAGKETIKFFHDDELDASISLKTKTSENYVKARGIITGVNEFDHKFFSINPKLAKVMDPQQRKFLEVAWEALESGGYAMQDANDNIGVFAGCGANNYFNNNIYPNKVLIEEIGDFNLQTVSDKDFLATRVAYALDLKGPAVTVQSACSTSLLAIAQAVESIRSGQCDVAIAGGITIQTPNQVGHLYEEGAILSNDGHSRTFDSDARGTVFCDGAAAVLLKNKAQAIADGDTIYAVIKGVGVSNDGGNKGSFTAPSAKGQAAAIRSAIEDANVDPEKISYVEAHGTATPIGDPIEIEGLKMAFGEQTRKQYCAIGSIKSNMGHLIHAAGAAGFIKTCLSLYHKQIPASINFKNANPLLNLPESPFYVNTDLSAWNSTETRIAGVSSFGVGGTNVHIILEEDGDVQPRSSDALPIQLLTWSAKSESSILQFRSELNRYVDTNPNVNLADLAYTLQTTRAAFKYRSFVVTNPESGKVVNGKPAEFGGTNKLDENYDKLAFIFPGQGAQYLKMGYDLYQSETVYREAVDECAELLKPIINEDIRDILYPTTTSNDDNKQKLNDTYYTQPSLFITGYALAKLWMSWGVKPNVMIGHSVGEFVAAHLAGVFNLKDALYLIGNRALLMRSLPKGKMLAVRVKQEELLEMLPNTLSIAAVNSPVMSVVAGSENEIRQFGELLASKNIAAKPLDTSHAFHSSMMEPIVSPFEKIVREIQLNPPSTPIVSTLTGTWMQDEEATTPLYWARHLRETVQFSKAIDTLITGNKRILALECGPKNSSTLFIRQQTNKIDVSVIPSLDPLPGQNERISFLTAAGNLWINGVQLDWKQLYSGQVRNKIHDLPNYSFERTVCWIEPPASLTSINNPTTNKQKIINSTKNPDTPQIDKNYMRKINLIEKLKEILENAAGIETVGVDSKASFLEIGLDSLLLTQLALTLKKEFDLPITFRKLTEEYNSLDLLAEYLDTNMEKDSSSPSVIPTNKQVDLTQKETGSTNMASESPIDHISRQIQLLAQQIAVLQNGESIKGNTPSFAASDSQIKVSLESDITPEEAIELKKPFGATAKIERQSQELSPRQRNYLNNLVARYNEKTQGSKAYTQEYRSCMADPRVVSGFRPNTKELVYQLVVKKSEGSYLWDIDGNKYIDMLNGFGSTMLGYQPDFIKEALHDQIDKGFEIGPQHELAGEVSKLICEFTKHERVALCNTGSEAVLGAMRVARTVTGKSLIVAFSGSYHGIMDEVLVRGTKKLKTFPAASGILSDNVQNMLILEYGTDESLSIIRSRADEIAAVLVEPVQSRRPEFQPIEFLKTLRSLTEEKSIALVFDEVITGFRMHPGGAQALFDIKADIATYGKVVGGGMPIGVIAGSRLYMDALDGGFWQYGDASIPEIGVTYFAGTFVRHPLTLSAAKAILLYMKEKGPKLQEDLNHKTQLFTSELQAICEKYKVPFFVVRFGSLWKIKFKEEYPYSELVFALMRKKGIHIWDGFPCFLVESHTKDDLDFVVQKFEDSIIELLDHDFIPTSEPLKLHYPEETSKIFAPPVPGALLGKDAEGNPAWFLPDDNIPGKYLQIN